MPKLNQKGLAPLIIISLIGLALVTAVGTYFTLDLLKPSKEPAVTAPNPTPAPSPAETLSIQEVKAANEESLLNMDGVNKVEVGEKDGKPCVVVFTFKETDQIQNLENNGLAGYEVVVQNSPK